jgi:hypothetical protein
MEAADMKLRDHFAALAMQGYIAYGFGPGEQEKVAKWAYGYADAMLKEREKKPA